MDGCWSMDALQEAGLDLELGEMGRRLDRSFAARQRLAESPRMPGAFELSATEAGPGRLHVVLDADLPETVGRTIMSLAIKHGTRPG
jgi:hypothetical protein